MPAPASFHGAPAPASPFSLAPAKDDTALFQDARVAFSHLVPGRPSMGSPSLRPNEPPSDAVIHLQDAPITVRYRLEPPAFAAPTAAELARLTAERWSRWRANAYVGVDLANDSWLWTWGVEGAAVASYDVADSADHEELFVLVKQGMVLYVSWSYPRGLVDDPAYATFASVAEATIVWDSARWEQRGRVWPEGQFLGPGLYGAPRPKHNEGAKQLALAPMAPEERAHLLGILSGVVSGAGAPWVPLPAQLIVGNKRAILGATRDAQVRAWVEAAFKDVVTAHDLRGLAIMLGRALSPQRTSKTPVSAVRPAPR